MDSFTLTFLWLIRDNLGADFAVRSFRNNLFSKEIILPSIGTPLHNPLRVSWPNPRQSRKLLFTRECPLIQPEPREDIHWSISRNGTMPSVVERRIEAFDVFADVGMRGDWYLGVDYAPGHIYEVHLLKTFLKTDRGVVTKLAVDLFTTATRYDDGRSCAVLPSQSRPSIRLSFIV